MFFSGSGVLSRAAAFGGAEAAAELALQTRHELLLSARPARAGPRSQQTDLLLILRRQEGLPVAYVVRLLQIAAHQIVRPQPTVIGGTTPRRDRAGARNAAGPAWQFVSGSTLPLSSTLTYLRIVIKSRSFHARLGKRAGPCLIEGEGVGATGRRRGSGPPAPVHPRKERES